MRFFGIMIFFVHLVLSAIKLYLTGVLHIEIAIIIMGFIFIIVPEFKKDKERKENPNILDDTW